MKMFFIIILLIIPFSINAQDEDNSKYAFELSSNFKRLEPKFVEFYKEKLVYFLKNDKSIKNKHLYKDTSFLNKLTVKVIPILKFKKEALNYKKGQNIFSLLEIDTIDYNCDAEFFYEDTLLYVITPGYDVCEDCIVNPIPLTPGAELIYKSGNNYEFYQSELGFKKKLNGYFELKYTFILDSNIIFKIQCLNYYAIVNDKIFYLEYLSNENGISYNYKESPNIELQKRQNFTEHTIRCIAKNYPVGGKPWWKFW